MKFYQARNGKIYLVNGDNAAPLTKEQIEALGIDLHSLDEFSMADYQRAYAEESTLARCTEGPILNPNWTAWDVAVTYLLDEMDALDPSVEHRLAFSRDGHRVRLVVHNRHGNDFSGQPASERMGKSAFLRFLVEEVQRLREKDAHPAGEEGEKTLLTWHQFRLLVESWMRSKGKSPHTAIAEIEITAPQVDTATGDPDFEIAFRRRPIKGLVIK